MEFFGQAIETLKVLVIALGAGLGVWGIINLLEGYGADNPGAKSQEIILSLMPLHMKMHKRHLKNGIHTIKVENSESGMETTTL